MNRKEFLAQLSRLLWDIPEADRKDALEYYENYFEDAGEENEPSVIQELGSPGKVAAIIKAGLEEGQNEYGAYTEAGYRDERFEERNMPERQKAESSSDSQNHEEDRQEKNNWDGSRYHGEENGGSTAYEGPYRTYAGTAQRKQPRGGLSWPLLLVLVILTCPLWGGLGLGLLGVFLGLLGACIGILVALLFSGLGLVVGGVVLLANAFLFQLGTPATAVVTAGAALMMTALGLLLTLGFFLLVTKVFPPCFRWCIDLIQRILHRGHTGGDRT